MSHYKDSFYPNIRKYINPSSKDVLSGFIVSLLALPLSLGIASASDFPPIMGVLTAIVGGLFVSLFSGAPLTIKGPAAGMIVIVAGAVQDFGGGINGWHLTLGTIVVAALFQYVFGLFKAGSLIAYVPLSVVRGMLAAIGIIIISRQLYNLFGLPPELAYGLPPLKLYAFLPTRISYLNIPIAVIGLTSLFVLYVWPLVKWKFVSGIPASLVVLVVSVPLAMYFDIHHQASADFALVKLGNILDQITWNVKFTGILTHTTVFVKYVILLALIGSIESLLTIRGIDILDPKKRKSNYNKDLRAVGLGNMLAGILGGLPMIAEVARSSANVTTGADSRWGNFFHGFFLLCFVLLAVPLIELIPVASLAALLIAVGIKLANPIDIFRIWKVGPEQFLLFVVTVYFTLLVDILVGVALGIVLKFLVEIWRGTPLNAVFRAYLHISESADGKVIKVDKAAVFSNLPTLRAAIDQVNVTSSLTIDLSDAKVVDHTVMDILLRYEADFQKAGGNFQITGLNNHVAVSDHPASARILKK